MSEQTKIQWATHTGSPWFGCTEVSPGCANCYSRTLTETRLAPIIRGAYRKAGLKDWANMPVWGRLAPRVLCKGFWKDARRYNTSARRTNRLTPTLSPDGGEGVRTRPRMFPSMDDWLDDMPAGIMDQEGNWLEPVSVLADVLKLIYETPNLDWLLLTKRPEAWRKRIAQAWESGGLDASDGSEDVPVAAWASAWLVGKAPPNVWFGVSVEDQKRAEERIPELLKIPARVRFLSVEPLLGPIILDYCDEPGANHTSDWTAKVLPMGVDWVIVGGESGPEARACNVEWVRDIVRQCKAAGVPCFVKQLGSNCWSEDDDCFCHMADEGEEETHWKAYFKDLKGGDPREWPEDLRVRQMPMTNDE